MELPHVDRMILLADSQLLFPGKHSHALLAVLRAWVSGRRGVYIGAANGDLAAFFELAHDVFSALGATLVWQKAADDHVVDHADFYLLAGGDVAQGWRYLQRPAVMSALQLARQKGALFLGVSAGAIHLAHAFTGVEPEPAGFLGWLGAVVAVHEEAQGWPGLQHWQQRARTDMPLLALPMGGALVVCEDGVFQTGRGCHLHERGALARALPWLKESGSA